LKALVEMEHSLPVPRIETTFDLQRRYAGHCKDITNTHRKLAALTMKKAQAESDKVEVMRDNATYESNMCEGLEIKDIFSEMKRLVEMTRKRVDQLSDKNDKFFSVLITKVDDGVNRVQELASAMKYSHNLI
jgi:hypothetical protein